MEEQHDRGSVAVMGTNGAVLGELTRIVRIAENVETYRHRDVRAYAYKILREAFPGMINRDRWRELAGREPDTSLTREQQAAREEQERADARLLREHGQTPCCPQCNATWAAAIRIAAPPPEEEEEACQHNEDVTCRWCDADPWCQHDDRSCPNCDRCEAEHNCRDCDGDPDCDHSWECNDCRERDIEPGERY